MSGNKRTGPKKAGHRLAGDLIALGSKPSGVKSSSLRHDRDDSKLGGSSKSSSGGPSAKKFKASPATNEGSGELFSDVIRVSQITQPQPTTKTSQSLTSKQQSSTSSSAGGPQIIEVRSGELLPAIREALSSGNDANAVKILCGAMKQLKLSRLKPDPVLNAALSTLIKESPQLFSSSTVVDGLVAVLKRESSVIFKAKSNPSVYILAAQSLLLSLKDSFDWSESIAKVYVEDSLGDRVWVDLDPCKKLAENICTIFQTRPHSNSASSSGSLKSGSTSSEPAQTGKATDEGGVSGESGALGGGGGGEGEQNDRLSLAEVEIAPRFSASSCKLIKAHILQVITDHLGRPNMPLDNIPRNMLKFLTTSVGLPELRLLVAQRIESWIQNPKLGKQCQELLMTVAVNCHAHSPEDVKVIEALVNIRLKTKLFSSQFIACIKELIGSHPSNLSTVLKGVVNNELGQFRSPSNMALIAMMIHTQPEETAKLLGGVFQDFLTRKEDYLRALRGFLREIVRVVKSEFNFVAFCRSLMQERTEVEFTQLEQSHKERVALSLADLITCSSMLTANMLIREAYNGYTKGEKAMVPQLLEFFSTLGVIQRDAVWWIHTVVLTMYRPQPVDYKSCLRKILFLEPTESYADKDNWPPESDRGLILRLMTEACLKEDTLMRVLVIGLTRELPISPTDSLDIADKLVARAANAHTEDISRLPSIERKEFYNAIFEITAYRPPSNIQIPDDYQPPSLAISKLYWKGWILLLVLAAFNPKIIGAMGWKDYPMLRGMMEMVMTSNYVFPTSMCLMTSEEGITESKEEAIVREVQVGKMEKEAILEYENYLASSSSQSTTINESNSYLLNQVTLLQPRGRARRIPPSVIDLIKTVNHTLKLGQLLCKCRSPDFLLDVIKRQGTLESMKWLTELVESSHSSLEVLPVPCLCEFLMASHQDQMSGGHAARDGDGDSTSHRAHYKRKKSAKDKVTERHKQLVKQLQSLLTGPQSSPESCTEVLSYFLDKLTLSQLTPRRLALNALNEILVPGKNESSKKSRESHSEDTEDEDHPLKSGDWLLNTLPNLTHFAVILPQIYPLLIKACLMETNLLCLQNYLLFLTQYTPQEKPYESAINISNIIVDRFEVVKKLFRSNTSNGNIVLGSLLGMFRNALEKAIFSQSAPQFSSSAEFLLINFTKVGKKAIIHTALIQAAYLLLSCDLPHGSDPSDFKYLLEMWCPLPERDRPEAYTVESKEATSLPPALILCQLLFSTNSTVLEVTIQASNPSQLYQFVQQFGCPLQNTQKVLQVLDGMCDDHDASNELRRCIDNPAQAVSFVEVHLLRGTENGRVFLSFLQGLASVAPSEPISDMSSVLEHQEIPSFMKLGRPHDKPIHLKQPSVSEISKIPQERMEQHLLQIFAPSLSRISVPSNETKKLTSELQTSLQYLISSNLSGSGDATVDSTQSLNSHISGLITALHKLVTGSSIRRQFLEGMIRNHFSITLLRTMTKIQRLNQSEDLSAGLFKATIQHLLGALDSIEQRGSKLRGLKTFHAVVRVCAEQLKIKKSPEGNQLDQRLTNAARDMCKVIRTEKDPFQSKVGVMKTCLDVIKGPSPGLAEEIVKTLVQQSLCVGNERKCIEFLQALRDAVRKYFMPIVLQCNPELFTQNNTESLSQENFSETDDSSEGELEAMDTSSVDFNSILTGKVDFSGLFVDLQDILDPEILQLCLQSSLKMVFGHSEQNITLTQSVESHSASRSSSFLSGQGYMLNRITNDCSWPTLINTIATVLDMTVTNEMINPSAVLDFLWACLHKPCLWQERVKREAVVNSNLSLGIDEESQIYLTPSQLECLLGYILKEAAHCMRDTDLKKKEADVPPAAKTLLQTRLPLLMCCCQGDQNDCLGTVVKYLQTNSSFPSLSWQLLVHLYLANERVISFVDHTHPLSVSALDAAMPSKLDTELYYLLSAVGDASPGPEGQRKMSSAALLFRKVAIHHPALMLRQLPLLGWLLRGHAHLGSGEFKNSGHKLVFENALTILELMQPLVFKDSQTDALNSCLEPFFEFMMKRAESKKYQSIVTKFADFLVQYAQHNRAKASGIIFKHLDILRCLSDVHTNKKSSLKSLIDCFPDSTDTPSTGDSTIQEPQELEREGMKMMMVPPTSSGHSLTHEQVMPFLKKLEHGQMREDILKVLQDLEETSLHSVDILKHFVPELCRIIQDPEPTSCRLAHSLLLRHLKQQPSAVDNFLPSFISCLESRDHVVVMTAVNSLPDLVLLCKAQDACLLLSNLFNITTHSTNNCTSELTTAIEACTQHTFR